MSIRLGVNVDPIPRGFVSAAPAIVMRGGSSLLGLSRERESWMRRGKRTQCSFCWPLFREHDDGTHISPHGGQWRMYRACRLGDPISTETKEGGVLHIYSLPPGFEVFRFLRPPTASRDGLSSFLIFINYSLRPLDWWVPFFPVALQVWRPARLQ